MYAAGVAGNGTAATVMALTTPVFTDKFGSFALTGDYHCASTEDQVYIVARGGNPGLTAGTNNTALVLVNALGRCGDLNANTYITINEVTTVAAAWALAPFMNSAVALGSSSTNVLGLKNAFLNTRLLANPATGMAATLPSSQTLETNKLYALADALAPCVNSSGPGSAACLSLFSAATPSGGTPPVDTLTAALSIVKHPGSKVAAVYALITPQPPFATGYTQAPSDWTMSLAITGGGLSSPTALGLDALGNVWVGNFPGVLSEFTPQGTAVSSTGYGVGTISEVYGLTVDPSGNIWVANEEFPKHSTTRGSVSKFLGAASGSPGTLVQVGGSPYLYDVSVDFPLGLAADTNGNIAISNYANSSATILDTNGGTVADGLGVNQSSFPGVVAIDANHGVWLANQTDVTVTHIAANGTVLARPTCCNGANAVAVDAFGNAWVANYYGGGVSEISNAGTVLINNAQGGGLANGYPSNLAIDAAQNLWVSLYRATGFAEVAGNGGTVAAGTALSPAQGFGQDAGLLLPYSLLPDRSGNLWISSFGNSTLFLVFGVATPTATPNIVSPVAP